MTETAVGVCDPLPEVRTMNLLVVEDDAVLGKALQQGLTEAGYECTWVRNGQKGRDLALGQQFDAVVLDLMLPDVNGMEVLREMRQQGVQTPVLVLTALGSVDDRVTGLNSGADDYLIKPFAFPELTARLEAISRRSVARPSTSLTVGPLKLDLTTRRVTRDSKEIALTPTEFSLLEYLMRYHGQVVTRKMLCEH
jgi:two-component system OmpR family response regulator/two-component system copper resistance phosphate regulon response regulator CusR